MAKRSNPPQRTDDFTLDETLAGIETRMIEVLTKTRGPGVETVETVEVEAEIYGPLALHESIGLILGDYTVTHIKSKHRVVPVEYKYQGRGIIGELEDLDWNFEDLVDMPDETRRLAEAGIKAFFLLSSAEQCICGIRMTRRKQGANKGGSQ